METEISLVGQRMSERLEEISSETTKTIARNVDYLDEPELLTSLAASVEGNATTIASMLCNAIPLERVQAHPATIEYAHRLAQRGIPSDSLRRAYHVGTAAFRAFVFEEVLALDSPPEAKLEIQHYIDGFFHSYIDWITQEVLAVHAEETRHRLEDSASATSSLVRQVLDQQPVAPSTFEARAHYRLDLIHRAAMVWVDDANPGVDSTPALLTLTSQVARAFGRGTPHLFTAVDRGLAWVWFGVGRAQRPDPAQLDAALAELPGSKIAFGSTEAGVVGFRCSHVQAEAAMRVALASGKTTPRAMFYGDPGVAITSVLVHDLPATQAWVADQLRGLCEASENAERLRETLSCFLANESSHTRTANAMNLHRNTVRYRVEKAIELRGKPLASTPTDLAMALQVCEILGLATRQFSEQSG
ncbi:CdaR family transcriptional regulator [Auritidibacter sp. NML100628]|uniref:PucR family transcriptional regulator n=1 Tax=Auritidibacter sp. NML100628 TaxID=2170742 RepID=UPI000D73FEDD|nr:helix-turn-helix domain-containing protein [Auritidibacter sp. NML100628]PXA76843.1 polyketide synthase regulator [Auritidibacter sp. NML100628]